MSPQPVAVELGELEGFSWEKFFGPIDPTTARQTNARTPGDAGTAEPGAGDTRAAEPGAGDTRAAEPSGRDTGAPRPDVEPARTAAAPIGPIELEIGTGKAGFLLRRARAYPDRCFLGIEWANEFYRYAVDRMERWHVPNVRLLRTDAAYFVRIICPRESLAVLHVYHPDPWPKTRHRKRRLIQQPFVDAAVACLVPGGRWAVQTDHAEYFEQMRGLLLGHPQLVEVAFDDPEFGVRDARIETNFEIKYEREGRAMYQLAVQRRA
jgi:tRNA (guanine-N7-)-methyltransferase